MGSPKDISANNYTYELPEEKIAKFPVQPKHNSKLLIYKNGEIKESTFLHLPEFFEEDTLLLMNNTKVLQARLIFEKESGGKIEVFCLKPTGERLWQDVLGARNKVDMECLVGGISKWKKGPLEKKLQHNSKEISLFARYLNDLPDSKHIELSWTEDITFAEILEIIGETPLPPYINRKADATDKQTYQTYYAAIEGSVAAPTAGLHFTKEVFTELDKKNIERQFITLHVGAGTFKPIKSEKLGEHEMHSEWICVTKQLVRQLLNTKGKVITVGTTSLRLTESLYWLGVLCHEKKEISVTKMQVGQWDPYELKTTLSKDEALKILLDKMEAEKLDSFYTTTQILIAPGYDFKIADGLITNFHQPGSTLLLLIAAVVGDNWKKIYKHALTHDFRFLSYGDSSLLWVSK
jgi:S-adenosylmethionine:tRNA ribosyltransferase-isomerase